jgi:hypothetical protein
MRLISHFFRCALAAFALTLATAAQGQAGVSYEPPSVDYAEAPAPPLRSGVADPVAAEPAPPPPEARRGASTRPRIEVGAYLEANVGISADLAGGAPGGEDVVTYTSLAAGVEGTISTRRVQASGAYRYERRFDIEGNIPDEDVHSGIAQVHVDLARGLAFDAGALATRTGGAGRAIGVTDRDAAAEVYSAYAGPSVSTRVGPVAVNASYRLGYVHVDDDSLAGAATAEEVDESTVHLANASLGMAPGDAGLPFGWTVGIGYVRDETGTLDNAFEGRFVRGDVVLPVGPTLALTAGIGYASFEAGQADVVRDGAGRPVRDPRGNLIVDPSRPRLTTYDSDGLFYDAGLIWRPNARAEIQIRAGADQDDNLIVAGSAAVQIGRRLGLSAAIFDQRSSFGQGLVNNLRNLPTNFEVDRNPITGNILGCVFGEEPGQGGCLIPALQSLSSISYRARGANLILSGSGRLWSFGVGASYTHRRYHLPDDPLFADVFATDDEDLAVFASVSRRIGARYVIGAALYASLYDSDFDDVSLGLGDRNGLSTGFSTSFERSFLMERLQLILTLGVSYTSLLGDDSIVTDALLGIRYRF